MKEDKKLPKSLYDVVSELVTFIDDADYERKEKNSRDFKQYIENVNYSTPKGGGLQKPN